jgi:hypothetical protein
MNWDQLINFVEILGIAFTAGMAYQRFKGLEKQVGELRVSMKKIRRAQHAAADRARRRNGD